MSNSKQYFEENGYVVLKGALSEEKANDLTKYMFKLYEQGKLVKDDQCPLSDAVYGDPVFDQLLQDFAKPIGNSIGKTLLPTYTYARIYRPGEILKRHRDRPSCEISATLTLGFDEKPVWPIYFDETKEIPVSLDVGELAIYKGCEIVHWRPPFKGKWHVQVFLHYVDANGPYKDHVMDGRSSFGVQKDDKQQNNPKVNEIQRNEISVKKPIFDSIMIQKTDNIFPGYICIDDKVFPELKFTPQECQQIVNLAEKNYPSTASVGGTKDSSRISREIRSANIFTIDNSKENRWIYEKIANIVAVINNVHFDYEIAGITHQIQLIEYRSDESVKGHYNWHIDAGNGEPVHRKISLTAQLSDPNDYEGCELIINNHGTDIIGTKERGSVHLFPSYMPHKVSPITKGIRHALVIWIHGSRRFR